MRMYRSVLILAMLAQSLTSLAQSESGLLLEAEVEKKLSKKFSVALEADMRTRNDFKTMDRWSIGVGGDAGLVQIKQFGRDGGRLPSLAESLRNRILVVHD